MQRSIFQLATSCLKRQAGALLIAGTLLLGGCANASTHVTSAQAAPRARVKPDVIYVAPFAVAANQVQLDGGIAHRITTPFASSSQTDAQTKAATQASQQVADEIVHRLKSMGFNAQRYDGMRDTDRPAANAGVSQAQAQAHDTVYVEGRFDALDAGSRGRRLLIGFGAGKSKVSATVALVYHPAGGTPVTLVTFTADADSGKAPGIAATAGIGAAADRAGTALITSTGVHGVSEVHHDTLSADTERMADAIAKQLATQMASSAEHAPADPAHMQTRDN